MAFVKTTFICKKSCFLNLDTRILFYNAYLLPLFDYCSVVWGNCQEGEQSKRLKLQKIACTNIYQYSTDISGNVLRN